MKDRYETTVMSSEQISKILPHRYPFLLVDRVVEFEAGKNHSSMYIHILHFMMTSQTTLNFICDYGNDNIINNINIFIGKRAVGIKCITANEPQVNTGGFCAAADTVFAA